MARRIPDGTDLAGFRIEGLLHEGGNGYVYQVTPQGARDPGFPVVVKVPGLGVGESALGLVSFEIEQMIQPALTGPHVPRVVATGIAGTLPYLAMERVDGEPLAAVMARAPLPPAEVARIGAALADALHSVHRQDVIHHDVKPENFLRRADGTAVLLDYGYAHHRHFPDLLAEESHHAAGSAAYVSPEQLSDRRGDPRKLVLWKKLAKADELISRDGQQAQRHELWLDYEQAGLPGKEARISRLCAWVLAADRLGSDYGLRLPGLAYKPASGAAHRLACLEALALC